MNRLLCLTALLLTTAAARAQMSAGTWTPIFKGIDYAVGTNRVATTVTTPIPGGGSVVWTNSRLQSVRMVRVDLSDADVALFATPRASNYVAGSRETLSLSVSNFVKNNGLAVGANAGFYTASPGGGDPSSEGVPCQVYGLQMCTGVVVSAAEAQNRYASLLFTTNKQPTIVWTNTPPGTNTTGMFTAVTGYYPLLTNGVNVWAIYSNQLAVTYNDPSIHSEQPRTAYGLSANRRYLFLMVIDGRQSGYSTGAIDRESGQWMLLFGAADAINMDGGGPWPLSHNMEASGTGQSELEDAIQDALTTQGRKLSPDPEPQKGSFFRSDHFSLAKVGIPAISPGNGRDLVVGGTAAGQKRNDDYEEHAYHQPSDEWHADWDMTGTVQDTRALYIVGDTLANSDAWPNYYKDSEFRAIRDKDMAKRK